MSAPAAAITYTVRVRDPHAHLFEVEVTVPAPDPAGQHLRLPAWIPGSYMVRDFARHVVSCRAESVAGADDGEPVAVRKVDKSTWQCAPAAGTLRVVLEVYAFDLSVRGAYLDQTRGYFNGVCLFPAVVGREAEPVRLLLARPPGQLGLGWRVATSLRPGELDSRAFGEYHAADYDDLIDHPVEMADVEEVAFEVAGVPHRLVLSGRQRCDIDRLAGDLHRICEQHHALFGTPADLDRYVFLVFAADQTGGGLEHRFANSCIVARDMLPRRDTAADDKRYARLLSLLSHEYFHLWHVKRTQPAAFQPFALAAEQYSRTLWVFEGITSYYDKLALVRAGVIEPSTWLALLGELITQVGRTPGRHVQSVAESSFDAWIKLYKRDENAHNAIISYYSKGSLVALGLDLLIRRDSGGRHSLDEVMRALWERHGATGRGIDERGFEALAAEITGLDLEAYFAATVDGCEDPPLAELLGAAGIELALETKAPDPAASAWYIGQLGAGCRIAGGQVAVDHVTRGGAAHAAGLAPGDRLIALDGTRLDGANFLSRMADAPAGQSGSLHAFRRDELMQFDVTFAEPPADVAGLTLQPSPPAAARALRKAWLGVETGG